MSHSTQAGKALGQLGRALTGCFLLLELSGGSALAQPPCPLPVFNNLPSSITVNSGPTSCGVASSFVATTTSIGDNLKFNLTGATLDSGLGIGSGHIFRRGITHVTLTATNACGSKKHFFDINVLDRVAPQFGSLPNITVNKAPNACGAIVTYNTPTATDNCSDCSHDRLTSMGFTSLGDFPLGDPEAHSYYLTPTAFAGQWARADSFGNLIGGSMVAVNSAEENAFLNTAVPSSQIAWLGLTDRDDEGTWVWSNGDIPTYVNWCSGQPDDWLTNQDYALIHGGLSGPDGCWDDAHPDYLPTNHAATNTFPGIIELNSCATDLVRKAGPPSGALFPVGVTTVTYQATDASGNISTASFTVTVEGSCAPASACSTSTTVTPSNTVYTGGVPTNIYIGYGPQSATLKATGSGSGPYTYLWTGSTSKLSCTDCQSPVFTPTAPGTYNMVVAVTNAAQCTSTATVTFCVKDIRVPSTIGSNNVKVYVCHIPPGNPNNPQMNSINVNGVPAHIGNHEGDGLGICNQTCSANARMILGADEVVGSEVRIYPSPTSNVFFVELPYFEHNASISLTDIQGRIIEKRTFKDGDDHKQRFDLEKNTRGLYMINVEYDGEHYHDKITLR